MSQLDFPLRVDTWEELVQILSISAYSPLTHKLSQLPGGSRDSLRQPWAEAMAFFVAALAFRNNASRLPGGALREEMVSAAERAIAEWKEHWCGQPLSRERAFAVILELYALSSAVRDCSLRDALVAEAAHLLRTACAGFDERSAAAGMGQSA